MDGVKEDKLNSLTVLNDCFYSEGLGPASPLNHPACKFSRWNYFKNWLRVLLHLWSHFQNLLRFENPLVCSRQQKLPRKNPHPKPSTFNQGLCWHVWPSAFISPTTESPEWFCPKLWKKLCGKYYFWLVHNKGQQWCVHLDPPSPLTAAAAAAAWKKVGCVERCELSVKKEQVNHREAVTYTQTHTESLPTRLHTISQRDTQHKQRILQNTHAQMNRHYIVLYRKKPWVKAEFQPTEFSADNVYLNKSPATWDEVFSRHLQSFIPGALHNVQPKQPEENRRQLSQHGH